MTPSDHNPDAGLDNERVVARFRALWNDSPLDAAVDYMKKNHQLSVALGQVEALKAKLLDTTSVAAAVDAGAKAQAEQFREIIQLRLKVKQAEERIKRAEGRLTNVLELPMWRRVLWAVASRDS